MGVLELGCRKPHSVSMAETTTVCAFEAWDELTGKYVRAPYESTRERIERFQRARVIPDTCEDVDPRKIDRDGRYHYHPDL